MIKWEHTSLQGSHALDLNDLGNLGWQLVAVLPYYNSDQFTYFLKREKIEINEDKICNQCSHLESQHNIHGCTVYNCTCGIVIMNRKVS